MKWVARGGSSSALYDAGKSYGLSDDADVFQLLASVDHGGVLRVLSLQDELSSGEVDTL